MVLMRNNIFCRCIHSFEISLDQQEGFIDSDNDSDGNDDEEEDGITISPSLFSFMSFYQLLFLKRIILCFWHFLRINSNIDR